MKTAEEWAKELSSSWLCSLGDVAGCDCKGPCVDLVKYIRSAQRDAIEAAAKVAIEHYPEAKLGSQYFLGGADAATFIADAIRSLLPPDEASK